MSLQIIFSPLFGWWVAGPLVVGLFLVLIWAAFQQMAGWPYRLACGVILAAILFNPSLRTAGRELLPDQVLLIADRTISQTIGERSMQTDNAIALILERLQSFRNTEIIEVSTGMLGNGIDGTNLIRDIDTEAGKLDANRLAGIIAVTDGQIHDSDYATSLTTPTHFLISGSRQQFDRTIRVESSPAFGIVGDEAEFTIKVLDLGRNDTGDIPVTVLVNGEERITINTQPNTESTVQLEITKVGSNSVLFSAPELDGELTELNNFRSISIDGVKDRLKVLLVSGSPHSGQRSWRNTLRADGSIDLIHFTILRSTSNVNTASDQELALIPFPINEIFYEEIDTYDVIIFDRYLLRGLMSEEYFTFVQLYVENGGALFVATGPEFVGDTSIANTGLRSVLPALPLPEATVLEEGFVPALTATGRRHPVTAALAEPTNDDLESVSSEWGRWFRQVGLYQQSGQVLMSGIDGLPLLILDRVGEGRVALLASDQAWLWQRGVDGGGPLSELLRRTMHWLMQEPDLEEESLTISSNENGVSVRLRTLAEEVDNFLLRTPDGQEISLPATQKSPGLFEGIISQPVAGNWSAAAGGLSTTEFIGPANRLEFVDTTATDELVGPFADATDGGVFWLEDGLPDIRQVTLGRAASGNGWLGLQVRNHYRTLEQSQHSLVPALLAALLVAVFAALAWRREGR